MTAGYCDVTNAESANALSDAGGRCSLTDPKPQLHDELFSLIAASYGRNGTTHHDRVFPGSSAPNVASRYHRCAAGAACTAQLQLLLLLLLLVGLPHSASNKTAQQQPQNMNLQPTLSLLLVVSLLSLAARADSTPAGTTTADSLFQPCPFPAFDSALQRFSKVLTFKTISSAHTDNHALHPQEFTALW